MRNADPYAPMISSMVPQIATLVILIIGSVEVEHMARYRKHNDSLDSGVVSLNKIWLMYDSCDGHCELRR